MKANGLIWSSTALCLLLLGCSGKENSTVDCQKNFTASCERELNSVTVHNNPILRASLAGAGCAQGNMYACATLRHDQWQRREQEGIGYPSRVFFTPEFSPSSQSPWPQGKINTRFCQLNGSEQGLCLSELRTLDSLNTKMQKKFDDLDHPFPLLEEEENGMTAYPQSWLNEVNSSHQGYFRDERVIERNGETRGRTKVCYWQEGKDPVCHSYVIGDTHSKAEESDNDSADSASRKKKALTPFETQHHFAGKLCQDHNSFCENSVLSGSAALWLDEHQDMEKASVLEPSAPVQRVSQGEAAAILDTLPFTKKEEVAQATKKPEAEGRSGAAPAFSQSAAVSSNRADGSEEGSKRAQVAIPSIGFISALGLIAAKDQRVNQETWARAQTLAAQAVGSDGNDADTKETGARPQASTGFATVLSAIATKKRLRDAVISSPSEEQPFSSPFTGFVSQANSVSVPMVFLPVNGTVKQPSTSVSKVSQVEPAVREEMDAFMGAEKAPTISNVLGDAVNSEVLTAWVGGEPLGNNNWVADLSLLPVRVVQGQSQPQGQDALPPMRKNMPLSAEEKQQIAKTSNDLTLFLQGTAQGRQQGRLDVQVRKEQEIQQNQQKLGSLQGAKAHGMVVQKDHDRVVALNKACDNHQAKACYELAAAYAHGKDMVFDYPRAQKKYRQVCRDAATGDAQSQYYCGIMQVNGVVVAKNLVSGRDWLQKSCQQHYAPACHTLKTWQK